MEDDGLEAGTRRPRRYRLSLALSGGGLRATLFHAGLCERLAELSLLPQVEMLSSVSGGSITAARILAVFDRLTFGEGTNFRAHVTDPIARLARGGLRPSDAVTASGLLLPGLVRWLLRRRIEGALFDGIRALGDLPPGPEFEINATDYRHGVRFGFGRRDFGSHRTGRFPSARIRFADAVLASAAYPIGLPWWHATVPHAAGPVRIGDGGIYDNLGLEPAWDDSDILISSDAGKPQDVWSPKWTWAWPVVHRSVVVFFDQVAVLRRRDLVARLKRRPPSLEGVAVRIGHDATIYESDPSPARYFSRVEAERLAEIRSDLSSFSAAEVEALVYHGYSVGDLAVRRWLPPAALPGVLPSYTRSKPNPP